MTPPSAGQLLECSAAHPRIRAVVRQCVDWIERFWVSELSEKQVRVQQYNTNILMWHGVMHACVLDRVPEIFDRD